MNNIRKWLLIAIIATCIVVAGVVIWFAPPATENAPDHGVRNGGPPIIMPMPIYRPAPPVEEPPAEPHPVVPAEP